MGLLHTIKRLLGMPGPAPVPLAAAGPHTAPPMARRQAGHAPSPNTGLAPQAPCHTQPPPGEAAPALARPPQVMLRREEMLDARGRLAGYRFSALAGRYNEATSPREYLNALRAAHVKSLAERRVALIAIDSAVGLSAEARPTEASTEAPTEAPADTTPTELSLADLQTISSQRTVLWLRPPRLSQSPDAWLASLKALRGMGLAVAVSHTEGDALCAQALHLATHCFIDFKASTVEQFEHLCKALRDQHPQMVLAAQNVGTWPERRLCTAQGCEFAMGDFLSTVDGQEKSGQINGGRLVLMEMLNLIRSDGDARALADVAKRDPGVAVQLLSMANSAAFGLSQPLTGIDQAITVLGREALYRWLAVSIYRTGGDTELDGALLEMSLARARLLELVATSSGGKQQADELFLVGLLSFVDTLLGLPMKDVLAKICLPQAVQDVLLRSEGPHAPYLLLAIAVEKGRQERALQIAAKLCLPLDTLNEHRTEALLWAEAAVR